MNATTVLLETPAQVTAWLGHVVETMSRSTPALRRIRAARIADLYEVRARLWSELGTAAILAGGDSLVYSVAEKHDRDQVKFFRGQAESRGA